MSDKRTEFEMLTSVRFLEKRKLGEFTEEYILRKAKEQYESAEATFKINPRTTALLVIDMQRRGVS